MPFPFENRPKWPGPNTGVQNHLAGINLPVVAGVSLLPGPLRGKELHFMKIIFNMDYYIFF